MWDPNKARAKIQEYNKQGQAKLKIDMSTTLLEQTDKDIQKHLAGKT